MKLAWTKQPLKSCSVYSTSRGLVSNDKKRGSPRSELLDNDESPIDQSQSLFLTKLSPGIRLRIFQYLLPAKNIHFIRHDESSTVNCSCPMRECETPQLCPDDQSGCYGCSFYWMAPYSYSTRSWWSKSNLLIICRQIYNESIDILASNNNITIIAQHQDDLRLLSDLQVLLRPSQYEAIRSLEICYHFPSLGYHLPDVGHHEAVRLKNTRKFDDFQNPLWFTKWSEMCSVLMRMKGLQDLNIWINNEYSYNKRWDMTPEEEYGILEPLTGITTPNSFNVQVSWPATSGVSELLQNAPFRLTRRTGFRCPYQLKDAKPYVDKPRQDSPPQEEWSSSSSTSDEEELEKKKPMQESKKRPFWMRLMRT